MLTTSGSTANSMVDNGVGVPQGGHPPGGGGPQLGVPGGGGGPTPGGWQPPPAPVGSMGGPPQRTPTAQQQQSAIQKSYLVIAPHCPCFIPDCMCRGWKNPMAEMEARFKEAVANGTPMPPIERKTHCRDCGHELTDHGNLLQLPMPELKRRVILAIKITNYTTVRDQDVSREIAVLKEQLNRVPQSQMSMQITQGGMPHSGDARMAAMQMGNMGGMSGMSMGSSMVGRPPHAAGPVMHPGVGMPQNDGMTQQPMSASHYNQTPNSPGNFYNAGGQQDIGTPPFEKPIMQQIMRNYVNAYKLIPKIKEVQKQNIERISLLLINTIDNHRLMPPREDDPQFHPRMLAYQRWLTHCDPSKFGNKYKTSEVFGFHMLRFIFEQVKTSFVQSSMAYKEIQSLLPSFVRNLEKELHKEVSSILDEGLLQRFEQYRNRFRMQQMMQGMPGQMPNGMQQPMVSIDYYSYDGYPFDANQHSQPAQTMAQHAQSPSMSPVSPGAHVPGQLAPPPGSVKMEDINAQQSLAGKAVAAKKKRKLKDGDKEATHKKVKAESDLSSIPPPDDGDTTPRAWIISNTPHEKEQGLLYWGKSRIPLSAEKKDDESQDSRGRGGKGKAKTAAVKEDEEKKEEPKQVAHLDFKVVSNNGVRQHMFYLVDLKNIFSRQLPKMPREYISRLVLDVNHRSVVCLKDGKVIGGICFRPFPDYGFLEIAFLAVSVDFQIRGIGRHVLNHLKEFAKTQQLYYFLTYADNYAIGFFKKLGFTEEITLDKKRWVGVIKDYDAGTPMECVISPLIHYLELPLILKKQREVVQSAIKGISPLYEVARPGLNFQRKLKRVRIQDIPGIKDSTWRPERSPEEEDEGIEVLQVHLEQQLKSIQAHPSAWPFLKPVSRKEAPHYYEIIKDPIDLETMEKRLTGGQYYITQDIFIADLRRMFSNCRTYNAPDTVYYKCADQLEKHVDEIFDLQPVRKKLVD